MSAPAQLLDRPLLSFVEVVFLPLKRPCRDEAWEYGWAVSELKRQLRRAPKVVDLVDPAVDNLGDHSRRLIELRRYAQKLGLLPREIFPIGVAFLGNGRTQKARPKGPNPSPDDIRERAAAIRGTWSDAEFFKRAGITVEPWTAPWCRDPEY